MRHQLASRTTAAPARFNATLFALSSLLLAACGFDTVPASFDVRESIEQLHVTEAEAGVTLGVYDEMDQLVAEGMVDFMGALVFRELEPGEGYRVREVEGVEREESGPHTVLSVEESQPDPSFYSDQVLEPGFNYITTRDGTQLSAYIYLPGPPEEGPYPTLIGYSGYEPSRPGAPLGLPAELQEQVQLLCNAGILTVLCDAPNHPVGIIGGLFGFATVGVNIRGTGCSGGAFDYFETLQILDGYDVVETVAAQDWVLNNKVGLGGLSYPGISQLFVAQTQPPSLASITPLSVIAESTSSVLAPGGIFNDGFAFEWTNSVLSNAQPYGQGWEEAQVAVEAGEDVTTCADNQRLHAQAVDAIQKALDNPWYDPAIVDPVNPTTFVDQIEVPVFLSGQWQDEQTGPHFANLIPHFTNAPVKRFTVTNGLHPDGYSPQVMAEWLAFNQIYVANRVPFASPLLRNDVVPLIFEQAFGVELDFPPIPFSDAATLEDARDAFEAQDELRVIFESGAADKLFPDKVGSPAGTFEEWFPTWPPPTAPLRLYFNADGSLRETLPVEEDSASAFAHDPAAGQRTLSGGQPFYVWAPTPEERAAVFLSDPVGEDTVMIGGGSADLWVQSTADDADLEVILSEVRPDGKETYVQAGWLRVSQRALREDATPLRPIKTHLESDAMPLEPGGWTFARLEIFPFGHIFRAGSRIRIQVDTPGDSRERWRFRLQTYDDDVTHFISHSEPHPSSVLLPVVSGIEVPTEMPPCPSLRGQPCRDHEHYLNALMTLDEVVDVPDAALESELRSALGIPLLALGQGDLAALVSLDLTGAGIADLTGLEYAAQLRTLDVSFNPVSSIAALADLPALEDLAVDCGGLDSESTDVHLPALVDAGVAVACPEPAAVLLQLAVVAALFGIGRARTAQPRA